MEKEQAQRLAEEWYAAWNDHDLERILSHYSDVVVFVSPSRLRSPAAPTGVSKARRRCGPTSPQL
jgi:ketosteroid isomerase-like protein